MYSKLLIVMGDLITDRVLLSAIVGGFAVVFILRAIKNVKDRRDSNRIYEFLRRCAKDGQYVFRSSEAISTVTRLPESRIADLCSKPGTATSNVRKGSVIRGVS